MYRREEGRHFKSSGGTPNSSSPSTTLSSRSVIGQQLQNELQRELVRRSHLREPSPQDFHRQRLRRSFSIPEAKDLDLSPTMPSTLNANSRSQLLSSIDVALRSSAKDLRVETHLPDYLKRSQSNLNGSFDGQAPIKSSPWLRLPEKFGLTVNNLSATWAGSSLTGRLLSVAHSSFDFMKTPVEEIASQLTLLDIPAFKAITETELTSIAWNTSKKQALTPNVVAFTRRFNQVSFWVVEEILLVATKRQPSSKNGRPTVEAEAKQRADVLLQFIKISKKLFDLNNLHSCYAIVSALNSSPIYRLNKTWSYVGKKEKATFDKLAQVFNDEANFENLRLHCSRVSLPCIPYLGMYLRDLVYVDIANPKSNGINGAVSNRDARMDSILCIIRHFQHSTYDSIDKIPHVYDFLSDVRYIEELQKFLEEDNFKMSLKLEPPAETRSSISEKSQNKREKGKSTFYLGSDYSSSNALQLHDPTTRAKLTNLPSISVSTCSGSSVESGASASMPGHYKTSTSKPAKLFIPSHRKSRSLGNNAMFENFTRDLNESLQMSTRSARNEYRRSIDEYGTRKMSSINADAYRGRRLIDDSVVEEPTTPEADEQHGASPAIHFNSGVVNMAFNKSTEYTHIPDENDSGFTEPVTNYPPEAQHAKVHRDSLGPVRTSTVVFEGYVRRKTILKDGKKPAISAWIRYWIQLSDGIVIFHQPKTLRGTLRENFRSSPCKQCSLTSGGWVATLCSDSEGPHQADSFFLTDPTGRCVYRFKTGSPSEAVMWTMHLNSIGNSSRNQATTDHHRLRAMTSAPSSSTTSIKYLARPENNGHPDVNY